MPQPTAPTTNKPAEPPAKPAEATEEVQVEGIAVLGGRKPSGVAKDENATIIERQIARAHLLEGERAAILVKIGKNREFLRIMNGTDELNKDQAAWLATFYPEKEKDSRRSKEDIDATRKAREAARK